VLIPGWLLQGGQHYAAAKGWYIHAYAAGPPFKLQVSVVMDPELDLPSCSHGDTITAQERA